MPEKQLRTGIESRKRYEFSVLESALNGRLAQAEETFLKRKLKKSAEEYIDVYTVITNLTALELAMEDLYE